MTSSPGALGRGVARFFNTAGPCDASRHYLLSPIDRLPGVRVPIERDQYFVLHAPRQSGKTTLVRGLARALGRTGDVAIWATLERARGISEREPAEMAVIESIAAGALVLPEGDQPPPSATMLPFAEGARLSRWLALWARALQPRRLILFLDEADGLRPEPLYSLLAQLRAGYPSRVDGLFPASIGLIGLRDLRDYLVAAKGVGGEATRASGPTSPFNIKVESFTLADFTPGEIAALYGEHTAETGQVFTEDALGRAWHWSRGQPWLVNALAGRCVDVTVPDRAVPVRGVDVDEAAGHLVRSRVTHLDNLAERLREPRVARIVQAVLLGDRAETLDRASDDFRYAMDLGLLAEGEDGLTAANPIYTEVLTRQLTVDVQSAITAPGGSWKRPDGTLDFPRLMGAWRAWWRQNADVLELGWAEGYPEAVPHLMLLAFFQRVVNGGGTVDREFAAGRGAIDLVVRFGGERHVVEVKRIPSDRVALESVVQAGTAQLARYLDRLGDAEGWLVVFDQRPGRTWEERTWTREVEVDGKRLHVVGG